MKKNRSRKSRGTVPLSSISLASPGTYMYSPGNIHVLNIIEYMGATGSSATQFSTRWIAQQSKIVQGLNHGPASRGYYSMSNSAEDRRRGL